MQRKVSEQVLVMKLENRLEIGNVWYSIRERKEFEKYILKSFVTINIEY